MELNREQHCTKCLKVQRTLGIDCYLSRAEVKPPHIPDVKVGVSVPLHVSLQDWRGAFSLGDAHYIQQVEPDFDRHRIKLV